MKTRNLGLLTKKTHGECAVRERDASCCPPVVLSLSACGFIIVRLWFICECGEVKEEDDEEPQEDSEQENEQAMGVA